MAQSTADSTYSKHIPELPPLPKSVDEKVNYPNAGHDPRVAVMHSLLVAGWGQVYNNSWWKVPIIYTGLGLLASAVIYNEQNYSRFLALAKIARTGTIPSSPSDANYASYQKYKVDYQLYVVQGNLSYTRLADIASSYQRDLQLSILGIAAVWGINVIDAYIEAKFIHSYSIDNNLSIKIVPGFTNTSNYYADNNILPYPSTLKIIFSYK
jgi:hypothetical protein